MSARGMSAGEQSTSQPRILIVEDEHIVALDLERSLTDLGYLVTNTTDSGKEAVALAESSAPDVVLMDIRLPGEKDGIAAAAEIRQRFQIPIIFLTASVSDETLLRAKQAAPYAYVIKPFRPRELNATIVLALDQHRIARELFAERTWLRTVLGSLTDGVIASDDNGRVRFMNASAEALTGWRFAEAIGERIEIVYPLTTLDGKPEKTGRAPEEVSPGAALNKRRFLLHRRDRTMIPIEDAAAPVGQNRPFGGAVIVFQDITERLRRERDETEQRERLEEQVQSTAEALDGTRAELRALSAHLMRVQEEERRRIGRELHDDLGQHIGAIEFKLNRLQAGMGAAPADVQRELTAAVRLAERASNALRVVSHGLHSTLITDLGIEPALRALVDEHRQHGEQVSVSFGRVPRRLAFETSVALYRIAQEGLRNASRHAAGAAVTVNLSRIPRENEIELSIDDAGPGFDLNIAREKGGLGLLSMQERARLAGGSLRLRSAPGHGTSLIVRVPVQIVH